jgi:hypothetical protein
MSTIESRSRNLQDAAAPGGGYSMCLGARRDNRWLVAIWLVLLALVGSGLRAGYAQVTNGTISGTVTDTSGARVPGVSIAVRNVATDIVSTAITNQDGYYTIPSLIIGNYEVRVQKTGFTTGIRRGIDLTVGREAVVDFTVRVGQVTEQVTVTGDAPLVETTDSTVGSLVDSQVMRDVPLNGRDLQQLVLLSPGVNQVNADGSPGTFTHGNSSTFSAAGLRPVGMMELLDGSVVSNFYDEGAGNTTANTSLGVDTVAEFEALTGTYSAEFGGQGVVINEATRSGTNEFHGSAYVFDRDTIFDANNYVFPQETPSPNPFHKAQFGGTAGGPILKDKTFFFTNYEGLRASIGLTAPGITLDKNARAGYVPCAVDTALPCMNGLADVGVSPAMANVLSLFPAPTGNDNGNGTADFSGSASTTQDENFVFGRVDHHFSSKDGIFTSYVFDNGRTLAATVPVAGYGSKEFGRNQYDTIQENHIFSAALLNAADVHFVRLRQVINPQTTGAEQPALDAFGPQFGATDILSVFGPSAVGGGTILGIAQERFTLADHLYWTKGKHSFKFGMDANKVIGTLNEPLNAYGLWIFIDLPSLLQGSYYEVYGPVETQGEAGNAEHSFRQYQVIPFVEDAWHVNSHLVLNMGLRYSYLTNPTDSTHSLYNVLNPLTSSSWTHVPNVFASNPSTRDFDPRFGFAYAPLANQKTSIRGGFGIFHDLLEPRDVLGYSINYPYLTALIPNTTSLTYPNAPPYPVSQPDSDLDPLYGNTHTQYAMERDLSVQQQVARGTVVMIGYEGSSGVHLPISYENNRYPITGTSADGRPSRAAATAPLNPNVGSMLMETWNGNSHYDSLQASVREKSKTVQSLLAYTWGKCIDYMSQPYSGDNLGEAATTIFDGANLKDSRGRCDYSVAQTFNGSVLFSPPLHGNAFLEGYQIGLISNVHSGLPFTPLATGDSDNIAPVGSFSDETPPDRVPGVSPNLGRQINSSGYLTWFNPAAFTPQPFGVVGNAGRDSLLGPKFVDFDASLVKDTKARFLGEQGDVQVRWEVFNLLNHPNFALPSGTVFDGLPTAQGNALPTAGEISATSGFMRQMQFAVKLIF